MLDIRCSTFNLFTFNSVMGRGQVEKIVQKESMTTLMNKVVFIAPPEVIETMNRIDFGGALLQN